MKAAPSRFPVPTRIGVVAIVAAISLAACSSNTGPSTLGTGASSSASTTATPTVAATPSPTGSVTASASESANTVPTIYDPCALVTPAEASTLTGASFTSGSESTTEGGGKICSYGEQGIVFEVLVGQSADAATAQAQEPAFKAELESGVAQAGIANPTLTELPGFEAGVDAAVIEGSATIQGVKASAIALYALKGAVFLAISEVTVGGTPATSDSMQAQAHTSLGRIQS
jgi:hypothetical protein